MFIIYASFSIFLFVSLLGASVLLTHKRYFLLLLRKVWPLLILNVAVKLPFGKYFFGLEYEDSYIWSVFARQLLYQEQIDVHSFTTKACSWGSLENCIFLSSYDGHLVPFSSILFVLYKGLGYSPYVVAYLNLFCSIILLFILLEFSFRLSKKTLPLYCVGIIFCATPAINVIQVSGLSETFSSLIIFCTISLYTLLFSGRIQPKFSRSHFILLVLLFTYCISVKRENLVLIVLPLLSLVTNRNCYRNRYFIAYSLTALVISVGFFFVIVTRTLFSENQEIGTSAFSLAYILKLAPVYIRGLLSYDMFLITGYCLILGVILFGVIPRHTHPTLRLVTYFFVIFFLLYVSHYRSYYFAKGESVEQFEALRYYNNVFPLITVIAGFTIFFIISIRQNRLGTSLLFALAVLGAIQTSIIRNHFHEDEYRARFSGVNEAIKLIRKNDILMTDIPLVVHFLGSDSVSIFDICEGVLFTHEPPVEESTERVYYLEYFYHKENYFKERYQLSLNYLNTHYRRNIIKQNEDFVLYELIPALN